MKNWVSYKNGNYIVSLHLLDGTKIRQNNLDYFEPDTIESADVKITNKCDRNCKFCVPPFAKLNVNGNIKNIADVKLGDNILSYNLNGFKEYKKCITKWVRDYEGDLIKISLQNGDFLLTTPNHKIYTKNRGYVRADELKSTDILIGDVKLE